MFNQKECGLLQDLKNEETLCVEKYKKYASGAQHTQLKNLFQELEKQESGHLNMVNKMINGTIPKVPTAKKQQEKTNYKAAYKQDGSYDSDKYLCSDALSTEKHVSSMYDTSIFEFKNQNVRDLLNHIQKDEQGHGEKIYEYMAQNGMYN